MLERYTLKKTRTKRVMSPPKPNIADNKEQLMGSVGGVDASDLEERFARGLYKRKKEFYFRVPLGEVRQPGWKELDFLIIDGGYFPVEIDETGFIHQGKETEDALKDGYIMDYLKMFNPHPVRRVSGDKLQNQEMADNIVEEMFP